MSAPPHTRRWPLALTVAGVCLLGLVEVLPEFRPAQLGLLATVGIGAGLATWRTRGRLAAAGLVVCAGLVGIARHAADTMPFGERIVHIDRDGTHYGPEYPPWPKVLVRSGGQPGVVEMYFRPLHLGVVLGSRKVPYQG